MHVLQHRSTHTDTKPPDQTLDFLFTQIKGSARFKTSNITFIAPFAKYLESDVESSGDGAVDILLDGGGGLGDGALGGGGVEGVGGGLVGAQGGLVEVGEGHGLGHGDILQVSLCEEGIREHMMKQNEPMARRDNSLITSMREMKASHSIVT